MSKYDCKIHWYLLIKWMDCYIMDVEGSESRIWNINNKYPEGNLTKIKTRVCQPKEQRQEGEKLWVFKDMEWGDNMCYREHEQKRHMTMQVIQS